jgi:hypothetical protein
MELDRLKALVHGLPPDALADLQGFLAYRQQANRLPGQLLLSIALPDTPTNKQQMCQLLNITDGSFRTAKSELLQSILQWHALNGKGWSTPLLRMLVDVHTLIDWNEIDTAKRVARKLKQQAEEDGRLSIAALTLELCSQLEEQNPDRHSSSEHEQLRLDAQRLKAATGLHRQLSKICNEVNNLKSPSMLLRTPERISLHAQLQLQAQAILQSHAHLPLNAFSLLHQSLATLAHMNGDTALAYHHLQLVWKQMNHNGKAVPLADYRHHHYFPMLIKLALHNQDYATALDVNRLHHAAIDQFHGNCPSAQAHNQLFSQIIALHRLGPSEQPLQQLSKSVNLLMQANASAQGTYDINQWKPDISATLLELAIRCCFQHGLYKECERLLALTGQLHASNNGSMADLRSIAPLISLAVQYRRLTTLHINPMADRTFESHANYAYDHFRKIKQHHPIEWELARLFRALNSGKRATQLLFADTRQAMAFLRNKTSYYKALMLLFDFEKWTHAPQTTA